MFFPWFARSGRLFVARGWAVLACFVPVVATSAQWQPVSPAGSAPLVGNGAFASDDDTFVFLIPDGASSGVYAADLPTGLPATRISDAATTSASWWGSKTPTTPGRSRPTSSMRWERRWRWGL